MQQKRTRIRVESDTDLNYAVLEARQQAAAMGFDAATCAKLATVVSELGRNILKYADRGEVSIEKTADEPPSLEIVARDRGPGIEDVDQAMADHFSTSGTLGLGLPGVRRMVDDFEITSVLGQGTEVLVRKRLE
jgi:serine/threonine-protein kinase RsbT